MIKNYRPGFTIVEILVFVTLLTLIFIVFAQVTTVSLRVTKTNENKIIANHLGEELGEWLRGQKELDFVDFATHVSVDPWCFNVEPINSWGATGSCGYTLLSTYARTVTLETIAQNQIAATIEVKWTEGTNTYKVDTKTIYALTE